ncbi:hypothetical protein Q5Y75_23960 [Ruegeria sp. 2205SS24-7]|uniref:hypothetical protein n=1 Tax=Ruegeria discodermiae TaxID=3064389 RepID=UPI0027415427|nr:hypothetical protein [Ruegeria sp. 2205SS24-7]MDP5220250.1 hypothetical protein [Ruegeria sp. 2205SS24-7]
MLAEIAKCATYYNVLRITESSVAMRDNMIELQPKALKTCMLLGWIRIDPRNGLRIQFGQLFPDVGRHDWNTAVAAAKSIALQYFLPHCCANSAVWIALGFCHCMRIATWVGLDYVLVNVFPSRVQPRPHDSTICISQEPVRQLPVFRKMGVSSR